jgi:hypothetical protein
MSNIVNAMPKHRKTDESKKMSGGGTNGNGPVRRRARRDSEPASPK